MKLTEEKIQEIVSKLRESENYLLFIGGEKESDTFGSGDIITVIKNCLYNEKEIIEMISFAIGELVIIQMGGHNPFNDINVN